MLKLIFDMERKLLHFLVNEQFHFSVDLLHLQLNLFVLNREEFLDWLAIWALGLHLSLGFLN